MECSLETVVDKATVAVLAAPVAVGTSASVDFAAGTAA